MIRVSGISCAISEERELLDIVAEKLRLERADISSMQIVKQSLDIRKKSRPLFVYTVEINTKKEKILSKKKFNGGIRLEEVFNKHDDDRDWEINCNTNGNQRPVVVGFGPAGMFAALTMAKRGIAPLVLERGFEVEKRVQCVDDFWSNGVFNKNCNVQFGEGGAGTFSDGKLTARTDDPLKIKVLEMLVEAGAPREILYWYKPHIGTDILRNVVKKIRKTLLDLGAEIRFGACVTDITVREGKVAEVVVNNQEKIACSRVFLAIGHSARDTYAMLKAKGVCMERKPFAMGVRIEHPQKLIDMAQYGDNIGNRSLGSADYAMTYQDRENERAAFSFCMCPGGVVVAAASEEGCVVTNGMSLYKRDSGMANSALVVNVKTSDLGSDVLAGIEFQRIYEKMAYMIGERSYAAPAMGVADFLAGKKSNDLRSVTSSYKPGVVTADLALCLPSFVTATLKKALSEWDKKIKGFASADAVLIGVETRTSAPVRVQRNEWSESLNVGGLYPIGEGAGYAGGIISSAIDGMKAVYACYAKR